MVMKRLKSVATIATFGAFAAMTTGAALAQSVVGQPVDRGLGLQPSGDGAMGIRTQQIAFHNGLLLPIITGITLFVLALLLWIIVRYNKRANPKPAQFSHNTLLEIAWTTVPVIILMVIAVSSFQLLYREHDMPKPDLTLKATGNQWYWSYTYPDNGGFEVISNILPAGEATKRGEPEQLGADYRMVVPAGEPIRLQTTGADVIHSFAVPSLWFKLDAVPGRVNEKMLFISEPGVYYGQCSELCGARHGYMPIVVEALPRPQFNAWVMTHAGAKVDGAPAPAAPDASAPDASAPIASATPAPAA